MAQEQETITGEELAQLALDCGFDTSCCYDLADVKYLIKRSVEQLREALSDKEEIILRGDSALAEIRNKTILWQKGGHKDLLAQIHRTAVDALAEESPGEQR